MKGVNLLFELHEWLPYIFSIGLIVTVSYAYIAHLHCGLAEFWVKGGAGDYWGSGPPAMPIETQHRPEGFCRKVRRRQAPDDDEPDCTSSLHGRMNTQRGGFKWSINQTRDSRLIRDGYVYSV